MSEVTLKINNRGYSLSCDEGQEERLADLGHYVDSRLRDIANAGAASNESHLLVLTALVLADELYTLQDEVAALKNGQAQQQHSDSHKEEEEMIARAIEHLAEKIERISGRLQTFESANKAA